MTPCPAAYAAGVAIALARTLSRPPRPGERLRRAVPPPPPVPDRASRQPTGAAARRRHAVAASLLAGVVVAVLVGGVPGMVVGAVAGLLLGRWLRQLEHRPGVQRGAAARQALPLAVDLVAACVASGAAPSRAVAAVSAAVGPPLSDVLGPVARQLALGTDPAAAWGSAVADPELGDAVVPLARVLGRSGTGARSAAALGRLSRELREQLATEALVRAQAVGVRAAGPLGLCFLPAFVLLGVVPSAAGLLASAWGPT